ncbi:MAG: hypothetical protein CL930_02490 [Deltaproteobacteria bacterium]|nr:hypothetical protein [Deltaproteobacteria bacterium]
MFMKIALAGLLSFSTAIIGCGGGEEEAAPETKSAAKKPSPEKQKASKAASPKVAKSAKAAK